MWITGKAAVIIGGAQGMGRACAVRLLEGGAKVCIGDINEEVGNKTEVALSETYGKDNVCFTRCDVSSKTDITNIFRLASEKFGQIEILYVSAAMADEYNWEKCVEINLNGSILATYEALNMMSKQKGGRGGVIILTSSVVGVLSAPGQPVYSATKHAIVGFAHSWGGDVNYREHGVRFNALCPGLTNTAILQQVVPGRVFHADRFLERMKTQPMMEPEDIANVFIKCCEDQSMNGQCIKIFLEDDKVIDERLEYPKFENNDN